MTNPLTQRLEERRSVNNSTGCWEWMGGLDTCGYGKISVDGKTSKVHRKAYETYTGNAIPQGMVVCHKCDIPSCFNPDHLFVGTQGDNNADRSRKGRTNKTRKNHGEGTHVAKLSWECVRSIRKKYSEGWRQIDLAAQFGVDQSCVSLIVSNKTWVVESV